MDIHNNDKRDLQIIKPLIIFNIKEEKLEKCYNIIIKR